jgi:predicted TIM-barrel fold metal-dependent hydrolase
MKAGRFIVDTHVHSQRHAAGAALKGSKDYKALANAMFQIEAYDNSARLLYDMQCYEVDMCVTEPFFGMTNETNVAQMQKYPDKFVCNCQAKKTWEMANKGEIEWTIDKACQELDQLLSSGLYVGVGEGMPLRGQRPGASSRFLTEREQIEDMMKVMDVCRAHKVPYRYHTGVPGGYGIAYHGYSTTYNPLWVHTLAIAFPDVPIILEHAGIEGGWWEHFYEECLHVAAGHKNVYLETGRYWTELYYQALKDPGVGAEKLVWGTDWGASLPVYQYPDPKGFGYTRQNVKEGIPRHQVDIWGWSLKQVARLNIAQDEMNLILGGNAVRLYNLKMPHNLTRMFKFSEEQITASKAQKATGE